MRIMIILILTLLVSGSCYAKDEQEPLSTMSICLIMHNWSSWGLWRFEIYAMAGNKVLIGDKDNHFLISSDKPGYSHVISGKVVAYFPDATLLSELGNSCTENCPVNYKKRTGWFKRRCKAYAS